MSADWQKGDLALCVRSGDWIAPELDILADGGPKLGEMFTVVDVEVDMTDMTDSVCLELDRYPNEIFVASAFRKVTPEKADQFDRETIEMLNCKPARELVS